MGPRLCRRGNEEKMRLYQLEAQQLQWGHVFVDVEMSPSRHRPEELGAASMGPRLCRRGNDPLRIKRPAAGESFNGATSL